MDETTNTVSLREITDANRAEVLRLTVAAHQVHHVATVSESFDDATANPQAHPWFRAVYAGETPVGFVMIADGVAPDDPGFAGPYYLWRLLIDQRWQRHGFGRATLDLVVDHVRTRPGARTFQTSVVPGPDGPTDFYLGYGFRRAGRMLDGEEVLVLALTD